MTGLTGAFKSATSVKEITSPLKFMAAFTFLFLVAIVCLASFSILPTWFLLILVSFLTLFVMVIGGWFVINLMRNPDKYVVEVSTLDKALNLYIEDSTRKDLPLNSVYHESFQHLRKNPKLAEKTKEEKDDVSGDS